MTDAKDLYDDLYGDYDREVKKNKFWGVVYKVIAVVTFLLGGYTGYQVANMPLNISF